MILTLDKLLAECKYTTSRSSGAGGQHVNKVETRVTIFFNVKDSNVLSDEQKELLLKKLKPDKNGVISLNSQKYKSQLKNKQDAGDKLVALIEKALIVPKKRKKTKVSNEAKLKRLSDKKKKSDLKKNRAKPTKDFE